MNRSEQIARYREQMGDEAAMRQIVAAENRHPCCGWLRVEGHHPDCKAHPRKRAEKALRKYDGDQATEKAAAHG